jgi:hypothetical protein
MGNYKEEAYMYIPEGLNSESNNCLLTTKTIFGHVQRSRKFNKKLKLKSKGFKIIKSDLHLLLK